MDWILEDHERAALSGAQKKRSRDEIVDHARDKLIIPNDLDEITIRLNLEHCCDKAQIFLEKYPHSSYKTHVYMTLIYSLVPPELMDTPEPWLWLKNERIGINTRVDLAYKITKNAVNSAS